MLVENYASSQVSKKLKLQKRVFPQKLGKQPQDGILMVLLVLKLPVRRAVDSRIEGSSVNLS